MLATTQIPQPAASARGLALKPVSNPMHGATVTDGDMPNPGSPGSGAGGQLAVLFFGYPGALLWFELVCHRVTSLQTSDENVGASFFRMQSFLLPPLMPLLSSAIVSDILVFFPWLASIRPVIFSNTGTQYSENENIHRVDVRNIVCRIRECLARLCSHCAK